MAGLMEARSHLKIGLASPKTVEAWASYGFKDYTFWLREVTNPKLLDDSGQPVLGGLFCQRIFGPVSAYSCMCSPPRDVTLSGEKVFIYEEFAEMSRQATLCSVCGVEITSPWVRRYRMGAICLVEPATNILYLTYIRSVLNLTAQQLKRLIFFTDFTSYTHKTKSTDLELNLFGGRHLYFLLKEGQSHLIHDYKELRDALLTRETPSKRQTTLSRVKNLHFFIVGSAQLSWMILQTLPVLPPRLRPFLRIKNQWTFSELNDLYRTVLMRNNRLLHYRTYYSESEKVVKPLFPESAKILYAVQAANAQCCIDNLLHVPTPGNLEDMARLANVSPMPKRTSLITILQGKRGLFRQNLLGKRVDFSGRSVVVGAPHLSFGTCGLPFEVVAEMFHPFVSSRLSRESRWSDAAHFDSAQGKYQHTRNFREWLQHFCSSSYIYLNRAPTLHRMNIQAFIPRVDEGQVIKFFPLACSGFNADFDGDQMGIFLPLSKQARREAKSRLYTYHQSFSISNGKLVLSPSQDMITGLHVLRSDAPYVHASNHHYFASVDDLWTSLDANLLNRQSMIWFRHNLSLENPSFHFVVSTVGRLMLSLITLLEGSELNKPFRQI